MSTSQKHSTAKKSKTKKSKSTKQPLVCVLHYNTNEKELTKLHKETEFALSVVLDNIVNPYYFLLLNHYTINVHRGSNTRPISKSRQQLPSIDLSDIDLSGIRNPSFAHILQKYAKDELSPKCKKQIQSFMKTCIREMLEHSQEHGGVYVGNTMWTLMKRLLNRKEKVTYEQIIKDHCQGAFQPIAPSEKAGKTYLITNQLKGGDKQFLMSVARFTFVYAGIHVLFKQIQKMKFRKLTAKRIEHVQNPDSKDEDFPMKVGLWEAMFK